MIAPAKTNLFLRVVRKRADGFHDLDILFNPIQEIYDIVEITENTRGKIVFSCTDKTLETTDNLCVKAVHEYFRSAARDTPGFDISLEKNIPVAAGMGGGSSDAAAVLKILNAKYGLLDDAQIRYAALNLGSDVPFFLDPVFSKASGRGEKLVPVEGVFAKIPLLMLPTHFPVPASWAYSHIDYTRTATDERSADDVIKALRNNDLQLLARSMRNDLEYAVLDKFPILSILSDKLKRSGAIRVMVSGSGPSLAALFPDFKTLEKVKSQFNPCLKNS